MVDHLIEVDLVKTRSESSGYDTELNDDLYPEDEIELEQSSERIKERNPPRPNRKKKWFLIAIVIIVLVLSISIPVARKRKRRNDVPSDESKSSIENCDHDFDNVFRSKLPTYIHVSIGGMNEEGLSSAQDDYIEDTLQSTYNSLAGCNDQFKRRMEIITLMNKTNIDGEDDETIVQAIYRSTVSYDCDEDICPDPEAPAFSSGPPLISTPPPSGKFRDRTRGRKRTLKSTSSKDSKKKKKKVISALDYFEQINESLQKMPKTDKNQKAYILDASTGAGVPKSRYKSKKKGGNENAFNDQSTATDETELDETELDATPTTDKDSSTPKKDSKTPKKDGKTGPLHNEPDQNNGWQDDNSSTGTNNSGGTSSNTSSSSGSTGTLFNPIVTDNGSSSNNGGQISSDLTDNSSTTSSCNGKKCKGKKSQGKKSKSAAYRDVVSTQTSSSSSGPLGGSIPDAVVTSGPTPVPIIPDTAETLGPTPVPIIPDTVVTSGPTPMPTPMPIVPDTVVTSGPTPVPTIPDTVVTSGPTPVPTLMPIIPDTVVTSEPTPMPTIPDTVATSEPTPVPTITDTGIISDPIPDPVISYTIEESAAIGCECASDDGGSNSSNTFCSINRDYYDSGKVNCLHDFYPLGQGDIELGFCDEVRPFCCLDEQALTDPSGGSIYASCREVACGTIAELDGFIDFSSLVEQSCAPISLQAWINEINYTPGTETEDNFVEIAFHNSLDIGSFDLYLYNGANGKTYNTLEGRYITPTVMQEVNGIVFAAFHVSIEDGLHANGDGMALYYSHPNTNAGEVLQFISYGGTFVGTDGAAEALQSSDIGVMDSSSPQLSASVQGEGCYANDYNWGPTTLISTPGEQNENQILNCS